MGENNVDSFFAGTTAGNGGLTKIGSGTLVITGTAFSHTGPTTIQAGALQLALASGTLTVSSSISGAGALQKYDSGTIVLTGTNTYRGTTLISSGTLRAGSSAAFSASSAIFINPLATLDVSSFNATIGSLTGSGTVTGSNGSLSTGGDNTSTTFTGLVLGPIRLIKTGTGSLTFNGNSFGSKQLVVDGGILNLGSSMDTSNFESVRIGPDGTLNFNVNGVGLTSPVSGVGSSSKITINANNITLGSPIFFNGFNHQGELTVADFTLNLQSLGFAQLGSFTHINTGTINALNGVAFGSGSTLYGSGTVNGKVSAQLGSVIQAIGNLSLGSSSTPAGFVSAGELRTRDNTVTLNSSSRATLGSLTTLGNGGSPGTVAATNGVLVDFGNSLVGYGTINTPNNLIQRSIINGTVEGNSGAQPITFTGWVKGVGTFTNVVFAGTWDPGFSPTLITAGSLGFSSTNNLIMELGGLTRGSQFDGIDATGNVNLAGALSITRINGFNPNVGDAFVLINRTGGTGIFAGLNEGDSFHGTDGGTYIISYQGMNYITNMMAPGANGFSVVIAAVPEPTTWALIGLGVAGCSWAGYRRSRKNNSLLDAEVIIGE
ncbi:MAG: autotransporter-associated beta strand repeat-containing protein [Gemmatales bacterium]